MFSIHQRNYIPDYKYIFKKVLKIDNLKTKNNDFENINTVKHKNKFYPIAFKNAAKPLLRCILIPSHKGTKTDSKASIP
jgi:hypothetical protein